MLLTQRWIKRENRVCVSCSNCLKEEEWSKGVKGYASGLQKKGFSLVETLESPHGLKATTRPSWAIWHLDNFDAAVTTKFKSRNASR